MYSPALQRGVKWNKTIKSQSDDSVLTHFRKSGEIYLTHPPEVALCATTDE